MVEFLTCNTEVAGLTASNLEKVANLPCAQRNSASYPTLGRKRVASYRCVQWDKGLVQSTGAVVCLEASPPVYRLW